MARAEQQSDDRARLSVVWQDGQAEQQQSVAAFEHVSRYAHALSQALTAAGHAPRSLEVSVRHPNPQSLEITANADVPGLDAVAFANLASLAVARSQLWQALPPDGEIRLRPRVIGAVAQGPHIVVEPIVAAPPRERVHRKSRVGVAPHVLMAVVLGALLGLFGIPRIGPRIEVPVPTPPEAQAPAAVREIETVVAPTVEPESERVQAASAREERPRELRTVFAERFVAPLDGWPNNTSGVAWFDASGYKVSARNAGRFVAIAAPVPNVEGDLSVSARMRKVGGPAGGGYGVIVRDQRVSSLDGQNQFGRFLVLAVGDQGDIGIWHREESRWIDLVPWTRSDAARTGNQANELTVRTRGPALTFVVNGTQVAELRYQGVPDGGGVGVFVGGDLNQVALEWLRIEQ